MSVKVESVAITPSTVKTGQQFIISVKVQVSTHERLLDWTHKALQKFTHRNLKEDLLVGEKVPTSTYERLTTWTHRMLQKFTHKDLDSKTSLNEDE